MVCTCRKTFEEDEDDETLASETIREISCMRLMLGRNGHPGVLAMQDVLQIDGEICMVMPKLPLNLTEATIGKALGKNKLKIAHGLLSAIAFVHMQGFMHRDIKGDNVMLTDEMQPVLIDFSIAKPCGALQADGAHFNPASIAAHTGNIGTAKYIAPEVYHGETCECRGR